MSYLAGRLAGKEASYFLEQSKQAVTRLASKTPKIINPCSNKNPAEEHGADVLPEVLRHSLPPKFYRTEIPTESSLSTSAKWALPNTNTNTNANSSVALNPLRDVLSLPQVTFGPKRWQLPNAESSVTASTANELRQLQNQTHINPDKVRAAAEGLAHIGKAFAVATAIIFCSATLTFGFFASQLDLHTSDDIRAKGKNLVHPKFETLKEKIVPLRDWAENTSKKWHLKSEQDIKGRPFIREISKKLRAKDCA